MRARKTPNTGMQARLISIEELREYTILGRNAAMELGANAGARVSIGKRILFDKKKIDVYINEIAE